MDQAPVSESSVVYLRSGSPAMSVLALYDKYATVAWFTKERELHTADIALCALTIVPIES